MEILRNIWEIVELILVCAFGVLIIYMLAEPFRRHRP